MTKEEWLQRMRELVASMPAPESVDLHKGRKGLKLAFSKLKKGTVGSTLSEIVGLLKEWDQAGLSDAFDPSDDGQRATAARLSAAIASAGGRWLGKHDGEDQAPVIQGAVDAARAVTDECARFEKERDGYNELLADIPKRSIVAAKSAADVPGLGVRLSAVFQAQMPTEEKAQAGLYGDATLLLPAWRDALEALEQGLKQHKLYLGRMQPIEARSAVASKVRARFDPKPFDTLKEKFVESRTLVLNTAKIGNFEDARSFCDPWEQAVDELLVLGAHMEMAVPPPDDPSGVKSDDQVKREHYAKVLGDLGKLPGGTKAIKQLVAELDPEAQSHGHILQAAVKEVYGVELKQLKGFAGKYEKDDETWEDSDQAKEVQKTSKKLFKLLGRVPESHVKGNDMFDKILNFEEDTGGAAYWSTTKAAYMHCGRSGKDGSSRQGREVNEGKAFDKNGDVILDFFPDGREVDCQPANDDEVPYFNWATLHEVGHAVDSASGFMDGKGGAPPLVGGRMSRRLRWPRWRRHTSAMTSRGSCRGSPLARSRL